MKLHWYGFILLLVGLTTILSLGSAQAGCNCACVNGVVKAICSSSLDIEPICPPTICPPVNPSVRPITPPVIPPIGTRDCRNEQVLNSKTGKYEWKLICR